LRMPAKVLTEPGITRFDIVQQQDDPTKFVLIEVYRTYEDPARHKENRTLPTMA